MNYINKEAHKLIIEDFLHYINEQTNRFILKGGTALHFCYGLDRFSEDIDFDSEKGNITNLVKNFCKQKRLPEPTEKKDTKYGQKFMVDYGIKGQLLKIETSHRSRKIDKDDIIIINGVLVYRLDPLVSKKANAFNERDKIRDLYDMCFMVNNYWNKLNYKTQILIKQVLKNKGMNQYDLVENQEDSLIDRDKLITAVLKTFEIINQHQ